MHSHTTRTGSTANPRAKYFLPRLLATSSSNSSSSSRSSSSSCSSRSHRRGNDIYLSMCPHSQRCRPCIAPSEVCSRVPSDPYCSGAHWLQPNREATVTQLNPHSQNVRYCAGHPTGSRGLVLENHLRHTTRSYAQTSVDRSGILLVSTRNLGVEIRVRPSVTYR